VTLRPHGIAERDVSYHAISRDEARSRLGLPADSVLLTIFGFVAAYKGHSLAVDALKKLPATFHLAIVGGPSPTDPSDLTLDSVLASWQDEAPDRLHITGYAPRETIDLYHAATDICLAPFRPEFHSGSASIGWALASGKPIIATNIPAFAEIQREGDCLLMCTPNCMHELAWHIRRLAGDRQLQHNLAQNALGYAQRHSWRQVSRALRDMYREMIGIARSNDVAWAETHVIRKAA
jgi:glycosyltransferase involved in cell wall biosynthesis